MDANRIRTVLKRLGRVLAWGLAVVILVIAALPFWLGVVLDWAGGETVQFEEYERDGYTGFVLRNIEIQNPSLTGTVSSVETLYPWTWLYRSLSRFDEEPFVAIGRGEFVLQQTESEAVADEDSSELVYKDLFEQVESGLALSDRWLPHFVVESFKVDIDGKGVVIDGLQWRDRTLSLAADVDVIEDGRFAVSGDLTAFPYRFSISNEARAVEVDLNIREEAAKALVAGELRFVGNSLSFSARTGVSGLIVESAQWTADQWSIMKSDVGIEKSAYDNALFDFSGEWSGGEYSNRFVGRLVATELSEQWPAIDFVSDLTGNLSEVNLNSLKLSGPGLEVVLNDKVRFEFESKQVVGDVGFSLDVDLAQLNVTGLAGIVNGEARFSSTEDELPKGHFSLETEGLAWDVYSVESTELQGRLEWPILTLDDSLVHWDKDVEIALKGEFDLSEKTILDCRLDANLNSTTLAEMLPEGIEFDDLNASLQVLGPFEKPIHKGELSFKGLATSDVLPLDGEVLWYGESAESFGVRVQLEGDDRFLELETGGEYVGGVANVDLHSMMLKTDLGGEMVLESPVHVSVEPNGESVAMLVENFRMIREEEPVFSLAVTSNYPENMDSRLEIGRLNVADWVSPWLRNGGMVPQLSVDQADVSLAWNESPAVLNADFEASLERENRTYEFVGDIDSTAEVTEVKALRVGVDGQSLVSLQGEAPAVFDPRRLEPLNLDPSARFHIQIASEESPLLAALLNEALPFEVSEFVGKVDLQGELADPSGEMNLHLVVPQEEGEHGLPSANIDFVASILGEHLEVSRLSLTSGEKAFSGNGVIDLPENVYSKILEGLDVDWDETQLEMSLPKSDVSPISRLVPQLLAPDGTIEATLEGDRLSRLVGKVDVVDLNTRSIFPFGALREINTQLDFKNGVLKLDSFRGMIGREALTMKGELDLKKDAFDLVVEAKNAPLLRQSGMLIRSDLDLKISQVAGEVAVVSGLIQLQEGLFMMDTSVLATGGGAGGRSADSRPPYFSVDVEPLSEWKLDLDIVGERFMRLRTPAITGELSMEMELNGTLEEPWLKGRVAFDEGDLLFPFAAFELGMGNIDFRIEDPYAPLIDMVGTTRRFGYDLSVDVSGDAFDPHVRFTSSPPLSSEQILLMVMAGENPEGAGEYSASKRASKIGSYLSKGLFSSGDSSGGIGSRLSIDSGQNLSRQGKETLDIQFRIKDRLHLVGEYDEYDAWNGGLRWNLLKQRVATEEKNDLEEEE